MAPQTYNLYYLTLYGKKTHQSLLRRVTEDSEVRILHISFGRPPLPLVAVLSHTARLIVNIYLCEQAQIFLSEGGLLVKCARVFECLRDLGKRFICLYFYKILFPFAFTKTGLSK